MLKSVAEQDCGRAEPSASLHSEMTIALRIRELRERKGWSQAELARRAGLHNSVVNRAERGETDITMATLDKLATALAVSPRLLIVK